MNVVCKCTQQIKLQTSDVKREAADRRRTRDVQHDQSNGRKDDELISLLSLLYSNTACVCEMLNAIYNTSALQGSGKSAEETGERETSTILPSASPVHQTPHIASLLRIKIPINIILPIAKSIHSDPMTQGLHLSPHLRIPLLDPLLDPALPLDIRRAIEPATQTNFVFR